jgi:plastocyanin
VAAELDDAGLEGDARARRRVLEEQRDGAAVERPGGRRGLLEGERAVQQRREPAGGELGAVEEMQSAGSLRAACLNAALMRRFVLPALALALGLTACGGSGSSGGQAASSDACPSGAVTIHMKDVQFSPKSATAKAGQTVCWVNDDSFDHDAVAESGASFKSVLFGKGKTFTTKLDKAGTVKYQCTIHPGMTGEIKVS